MFELFFNEYVLFFKVKKKKDKAEYIAKGGLNSDPSECRHHMFALPSFSLGRNHAARKGLYYPQEQNPLLDERC